MLLNNRIITVRFNENDRKVYSVRTFDNKIKEGDTVIIEIGNTTKLCVVIRTTGLSPSQKDQAHNWVIQKVDYAGHAERMAKVHAHDMIISEMDEILESENKFDKYKHVAKTSAQMARLLERMEAINNGALALETQQTNIEEL